MFFATCQVYLHLNKDFYPDNEFKIIFVLLYMVGGAAGAYKEAIYMHMFTINPATSQKNGFGTWIDFVKRFNEVFTPLNLVNNAITFMKALKQTGTANNYIAAFRPLAIRSGITEVAILSDYFLTRLSKELMKSIMLVEKLSTNMDSYYVLTT